MSLKWLHSRECCAGQSYVNLTHSYLKGRNFNQENILIRSGLKSIFLIIVDKEGPSPSWMVPSMGFYKKKPGWASYGKQASKQHPFMASASVPASMFLPCFSSCPDYLQWWTVLWKCKSKKPFPPPSFFWLWCIFQSNRILRQIALNSGLPASTSGRKLQKSPTYLVCEPELPVSELCSHPSKTAFSCLITD